MESYFDLRYLTLKLPTHKHNSTIFINLPKDFCKGVGLTGEKEEYVTVFIFETQKSKKYIDLVPKGSKFQVS